MTQTVRFVDTVSYTEADQADFNMRMMRPQGVIPESSLGTLAPSSIASMNVRVGPGEAFIQGFQYKNDTNVDLAIGANASGSTRIDIVVLSLNRAANTLILAIKVGTPGAGAPALTQAVGGNWEFPIAQVTVANGAVSITAPNIADSRVYSQWPLLAISTGMATDAEVTIINNALSARITVLEGLPKTHAAAIVIGASATLVSPVGISSVTRFSAGSYQINLPGPGIPGVGVPAYVLCNSISLGDSIISASVSSATAIGVIIKNTAGTFVDRDFTIVVQW